MNDEGTPLGGNSNYVSKPVKIVDKRVDLSVERENIISEDDITDLKIDLAKISTVEDFINHF